MKLQTICMTSVLCLFNLAATAQQDVTISPGDNVYEVLRTVGDPGSTITFEAGLYEVLPPADSTGARDLFEPPAETTIRGAGSGFNPEEDTIIDCQSLFRHGFDLGADADGVTVSDLTITNVYGNSIYIGNGAVDVLFENVWAVRALLRCVENDGGEARFNFCVFGLAADDVIFNDDNAVLTLLTNCDLFLVENDLVEAQGGEAIFRNCIFYAGNGNNYLENNKGTVVVRNSIGWDPYSGDAPGITQDRFGRLRLVDEGGVFPDVDASNIGEDPMYVRPPGQIAPGIGVTVEEMDLHLQQGSVALTVGNTRFDENGDPTGSPTFAGSQGETSFLVVDNMESYQDVAEKEIWATWLDGFDDPDNGSVVGTNPDVNDYTPETELVYAGNQSLPIWYDNSTAPISEATRRFDPAQDWRRSGVNTLSLFVKQVKDQGDGDIYIKIDNAEIDLVDASPSPPGMTPGWLRYDVDLSGMDVASVRSLTVGIKGAGIQGVLYIDDILLFEQAPDIPAGE